MSAGVVEWDPRTEPTPFSAAIRRVGELTEKVARLEELLASNRAQTESLLQKNVRLEAALVRLAGIEGTHVDFFMGSECIWLPKGGEVIVTHGEFQRSFDGGKTWGPLER